MIKLRRFNSFFPILPPLHCTHFGILATRAIEYGMNPKILQKLLGHGTLQMTMGLYCHVTEDTLAFGNGEV